PLAAADGPSPAERGRKALLTRPFTHSLWNLDSYDKAWKSWAPDLKEAPKDYSRAFMEHYGLHPAPYENSKYPMGLREAPGMIAGRGLTTDCMLCHGGSILGQSYVGLGNASLDIQALWSDLGKASGGKGLLPITFSNVRGTSEAGNFAVFLLSLRHPDLKL